jgi:glycosyltransferase involved in cell wall biosynthesis
MSAERSRSGLPSMSIVTPSYHQGPFIGRTVASVLAQDYTHFDYLVCDGASTDSTPAVLSRFADPRMRVLSEPDDGQADAIRKGFDQTGGEIVGWLNSDDILLPGTLAFVARFFADHPRVDALYSHRIFIDENDRLTKFWILPPHSDYCMRRWDYIPQETCFWRREAMDRAGGIDPSFQFAMDYDLFERMMRCCRFRRIHRFLAAFREHPDAKTTTLYDTLGSEEVEVIRSRVGMTGSVREGACCHLFGQTILRQSALYKLTASAKRLRGFQERIEAAVAGVPGAA